MLVREIKLKSDKEQIFEHFSEGAQPPRSIFQGWLEPPSPNVVGAYESYEFNVLLGFDDPYHGFGYLGHLLSRKNLLFL